MQGTVDCTAIPIKIENILHLFYRQFENRIHSMLNALFLVAIDSSLGRVDISSFTDQTLVEMLVSEFSDESKRLFQDDSGAFRDVCTWQDFSCDADGRLTVIYGYGQFDGTIEFAYLPSKLEEFTVDYSELYGTLETSVLPACMRRFSILDGKFHGTVDFTSLPKRMEYFNVACNTFTGSAVLDSLPDNLVTLNVYQNQFSGTLCLTNLPLSLMNLSVSNNQFSGKFHLANASENISVYAEKNAFCGTAVIQEHIDLVAIGRSGVKAVFDEFGEEHGSKKRLSF